MNWFNFGSRGMSRVEGRACAKQSAFALIVAVFLICKHNVYEWKDIFMLFQRGNSCFEKPGMRERIPEISLIYEIKSAYYVYIWKI